MTSLASCMTALATATACRCPPDSEPTGCRIDRTVVTRRSCSVCLAVSSMLISSSSPNRVTSWPSSMFCTMSRLSASARSWYTVAIPRLVASLGECRWTGLPCHSSWPLLGCQMPAMHLISVLLPAPLSPTRAVTWPAGMSRSMPVSACTGPKLLPMFSSCSSGVSPLPPGRVRRRGAGWHPARVRGPGAILGAVRYH